MPAAPRFFKTGEAFRRWLAKNHSLPALVVGFYRRASGRGGLTHREALDAALAYGWIDGIVHGIDADSYSVRYSQRARDSYWSAVNTRRFLELQKRGLVAAPGVRVFRARDAKRTREYSFERARPAAFDRACANALRANRAAAAFFDAQPLGYRKGITYWVMSAKKDETRAKRLAILIGRSARGLRVDRLKPNTP
jgi:uncharacterized protein YdeI (YjbR/CyaY-like superfamily)